MPKTSQLAPFDDLIRLAAFSGVTDAAIAESLEVAPSTVWYYRKRHSIPTTNPPGPRKGEKNAGWKGGRTTDKHGYILVLRPDHPAANAAGYVREHRLVMEEQLGRPLLGGEIVHHRDGNPANNDPANLSVYQRNGDHLRETLTGRVPNWSEEGKARIAAGAEKARQRNTGSTATPETRAKLSEAQKQRYTDPAERQRTSEQGKQSWTPGRRAAAAERARTRNLAGTFGAKGVPLTPEHRQRVGASGRATWTPERRAAHGEQVRLRHAARRAAAHPASDHADTATPRG